VGKPRQGTGKNIQKRYANGPGKKETWPEGESRVLVMRKARTNGRKDADSGKKKDQKISRAWRLGEVLVMRGLKRRREKREKKKKKMSIRIQKTKTRNMEWKKVIVSVTDTLGEPVKEREP